jgi:hypothetical protein
MTVKKSDGRIEVPRLLIKEMGWEERGTAFFHRATDAIWLYTSYADSKEISAGSELLGQIAVSSGRIRVPLNILNKMGFYGQSFAIAKENDHLSIQPYNCDRGEELDKFIDTLGPLQLRMLSNFICGKPVDTDTEHMVRPKLRANPIFLANKANTVFRAIGLPFRFHGLYIPETKEIVTSTNDNREYCSVFHGIPGIRRDSKGNVIGFLIVNDTTYGSILAALQNTGKRDADVEFLFMYDPMSDSKYKAYVNPPSSIFDCDLDIARTLCTDVNGFMNRIFRRLDNNPEKSHLEPPVFTDDNVRISFNI